MSDREYHGKEEEKEAEKDEKTWDEKWRRDPLSAAVWAIILIWAGVALLADNVGLLARFERLDIWGLIFIGAGGIVFLEVVVRLLVPSYRRPVGGTLVFAVVLVGLGLNNLFGWELTWPLILIAIGVGILLRGFLRGI
jgi:hypothetical protein